MDTGKPSRARRHVDRFEPRCGPIRAPMWMEAGLTESGLDVDRFGSRCGPSRGPMWTVDARCGPSRGQNKMLTQKCSAGLPDSSCAKDSSDCWNASTGDGILSTDGGTCCCWLWSAQAVGEPSSTTLSLLAHRSCTPVGEGKCRKSAGGGCTSSYSRWSIGDGSFRNEGGGGACAATLQR